MKPVRLKLLSALLMFSVFLVGCSGETEEVVEKPAAVHIEDGDECHVCGMAITRFPGPKGEVITEKEQTVHKFCSTRDMFAWSLQPENTMRKHTLYVHDMSQTEWESPDDTALIDAREAVYVVGSKRKGAMGQTLASFSTESAAHDFMMEHGGEILAFDAITLEHLNTEMPAGEMHGDMRH
ncbi:nitrous oxide reductase accessory protein NosL [Marinobacter salexigens]|jgi:copper chaperone NosL|uniref:Nitrous oxide reductase accessory protein NosL n=1 Tax=Marinobacter salexigens TaxID=1925763 RepID=A0ABS6A6M5_9GAMM|nr:nitrous oxide reductase accessory protein NosL [Marinobacter salexigens]MBU2873646.1 nitrous oxide reductase accessory protein NosL [Marinobacter salexigens]